MPDHPDDLAAGGVDHFDDDIGMDRQGPFEPGLQFRGLVPVLTQTGPTGEEAKDRPPLGITRFDHRLGDDAVVDELGIERSLAAEWPG